MEREMTDPPVYVSIDVETDGPIPGKNSMRSLGACAFDDDGVDLGHVYMRIAPLPGAEQDEKTMLWWVTQPEAWAEATKEPQEQPESAARLLRSWLNDLPSKNVIMIAAPSAFDSMFVQWYLVKFTGGPYLPKVIDVRSFAMGKLGVPYAKTSKWKVPAECRPDRGRHTHRAIDDAREQAQWFFRLKNYEPK